MTREVFQVEIPFGGSSIRIQRITERHSSPSNPPPSRQSASHGEISDGPGLVRAAVSLARVIPFPFLKSA